MKLKKSLGQHFLKDDSVTKKITEALLALPFSQLVEVGPGAGALTKHLIKIPNIHFKAVELDDEKVEYLSMHYPSLRGQIIHKDFLEIEPPFQGNFTVVGNFPYNISSQIVFKLLDWKTQVECMVGMFQKEVAERIAAKPGSKTYGAISVLVQAFFAVEYLFDVPPESFTPPPKVMSGVILMKPKSVGMEQLANSNIQEMIIPKMRSHAEFRNLVKTAFTQRRKTLRNSVRIFFEPDFLQEKIFDKRPEQLSVNDFAELTFKMKIIAQG